MEPINRRTFLGAAAVGTVAVAGLAARGAETPTADRKLKLGLIGAGWYGMVDVEAAFRVGGVEVLAVCDVDSDHLKTSADKIEKLPGILGGEDRGFPTFDNVLRSPDRGRGVHRDNLANAPVVKKHPNGCQVLLDAGGVVGKHVRGG